MQPMAGWIGRAVGLTLLVIGVGTLQFMLDNGNEKDWFNSPIITMAGVVSLVSVAFLIPWELTDKHPVIDLRLYGRRNFRVGTCVIGVAYFAFCVFAFAIFWAASLNATASFCQFATPRFLQGLGMLGWRQAAVCRAGSRRGSLINACDRV